MLLGTTDHNEVHVGGESSVETVKQLCQVSINFSFICLWRAFMLLVLEQRHRSDRGPRMSWSWCGYFSGRVAHSQEEVHIQCHLGVEKVPDPGEVITVWPRKMRRAMRAGTTRLGPYVMKCSQSFHQSHTGSFNPTGGWARTPPCRWRPAPGLAASRSSTWVGRGRSRSLPRSS